MNWYKTANIITLYQGRSVHNKGSKYWTADKEWARQFTQSGLDSEIKSIKIDDKHIYMHNPLPQATNPDEIDKVIAIAEKQGFNAIAVDEGTNEPNSILIFGEIVKPMSQADVDKWWKIWDKQEGKQR